MAQAHAALCEQCLEERASVLECIQCGRPISEGSPHGVEIDEEGLPHDVGIVHTACLRPTHRILGRVSIEPFSAHRLPPDFDHRAWIETRPTGQGVFNAISPTLRGRIVMLACRVGLWWESFGGRDYIRIICPVCPRNEKIPRSRFNTLSVIPADRESVLAV